MKTIQDFRAHNLRLLFDACVRDNDGKEWGAMSILARRTGLPNGLLSQLLSGKPNSTHGAPRLIGDKVARKLESGMGKPVGWMDRDHTMANTVEMADHMDVMATLTAEQRATIVSLAVHLQQANLAAPEGGRADFHPPQELHLGH